MSNDGPKTITTAKGQALGLGVGNACAYFFITWLSWKHQYIFEDPAVAVAMGGTLFGVLVLQFGKITHAIGAAVKYVFDRVFPPKGN